MKAQASVDGLLSMHFYSTDNDPSGNYWTEFGSKENTTAAFQTVLAYTLPPASNSSPSNGPTDTPTMPPWALIVLATGLSLVAISFTRTSGDKIGAKLPTSFLGIVFLRH